MNQKKSISQIQKQIDVLKEEERQDRLFLETQKEILRKEILKFKPEEIKNNQQIEQKYGLWERILKTLGMS
jgi:hypothetical protein